MTNKTKFESRVTRVTLAPEGEPIYSERAWTIEIDDEAAGEYVVVGSESDEHDKIRIDAREWPALREEINAMIARCRK